MKLYCVRHCEALSTILDPERSLSEQGPDDARKIAGYIEERGIVIPRIVHSGIKRAAQTAEYIAATCQYEDLIVSPELLDDQADVALLIDELKQWTRDTLLVGHMPYMANLVSALVMDNDDAVSSQLLTFSPGTMVCLNGVADGGWIIDWVIKPDNL